MNSLSRYAGRGLGRGFSWRTKYRVLLQTRRLMPIDKNDAVQPSARTLTPALSRSTG